MHTGWTNVNSEAIINFMLVSPAGAIFHGSEECSAQTKSGDWLAERLTAAIQEVGSENIVQVRAATFLGHPCCDIVIQRAQWKMCL